MQIQVSKADWSIDSVARRKDKIDLQPLYQRPSVWNKKKKQKLIDSILRGYDLPKFYLRSSNSASNSDFEHEVVDGQQRLSAIWEFISNKYKLSDDSKDIPDLGNLSGKQWSDLSSTQQDRIGNFHLSVVIIEKASDFEIRQLFLRLQEGVSLNPAEKRNAMTSNMRDFIANLGDNHKVFELIRIPDTRFQQHDLAAIVTCLEIAKGPTDVKAPKLKKMYEMYEEFNTDGSIAKKIRHNLNYLARVVKNKPPEMDIKWGFVDLYLLISKFDELYVIKDREDDFADFYVAFETDRRAAKSDPSDLLSSNKDSWDRDLYDYIEAFVRSGGTKPNIEKRHEVYIKRFLKETQNLVPKDPQRVFTLDERIVIWRQDKETCQDCKRKIAFDEMQADHIIPHSRGGQTTLNNAQTLCQQCNAKKGAA